MFGIFKKFRELQKECEELAWKVNHLNTSIDNFSYRLNSFTIAIAENAATQKRLLEHLELKEVKVEAFTQLVKVPKP